MSDYWIRRQAQRMFEYMVEAEAVADEISKLYLKSSGYLSHELDKIFSRFRRKHHLSEAEARRLLTKMRDKASLDELKRVLREEKDDAIKAELLAELEAPAYQARLEHLQQKQNQIDMVMREVYGQEKVRNTSFYVDLANESFYKSMFDIQQCAGYGFSFGVVTAEKIDRVINSRWSGMNYSDRIWKNTTGLAQTLKEELLLSLITGRTDRETAEIIQDKFATGASNARRLVRTEASFLANEMEAESYKECGIERYIYVATLDVRTCKEDCAPLDRKDFLVAERKVSVNYPPMHPWCRCTTIAYIGTEDLARMKRWARDPVTGKTMYVPADMTYEEWHKKYVEGNPEAELQERMAKNRSKDRTQHKTYARLLSKDVPERLDDFQRVKYTDAEKWQYMKLDYRRRNELSDHPELKLPDADKAVVSESKFTKYLFGGNNKDGLPKGKNFEERLGYNIDNWRMLQKEIRGRASEYPVTFKGNEGFGNRYEQKIILYGLKGKPANVVVGWIHRPDGTMSMTSTYIKEV
jgi:SPP1 gp7 family putative phage head morphogenesis protein|nr:MAG TPA_asm: minor capsid protein [Caudoviricetes sp.]